MHARSCAHSYVARQSATRAWSGAHSSCLRVAGLPGATSESGKSWKPDLLTLNPVCVRANLGPWVARSAFGSSGFERTDWWEGACVAFWKQSEPSIVVRLAIENDKNAKPIATTVALSLSLYIYRCMDIFIYVFYVFICLGEGSLYIQSVIALINLRHSWIYNTNTRYTTYIFDIHM